MVDLKDYMIIQVFDALLIDEKTNKVIAKDKLQSADIEVSTESKEIKAGQSNAVIATIAASRNITVKLAEPVFNLGNLAMNMGQDIITGAGIAPAMAKIYKVGAEKTIELDNVPIVNSVVIEGGVTATVTTDSKVITLSEGAEGDDVKVLTYLYQTDAKTQTINIDGKKFATAKKLILQTTVFTLEQEPAYYLQYEFPMAKPVENFSIQTKSETDPVVTNLELKILEKGGSQGTIRLIPIEDSVVSYGTLVSEKTKVSNQTIVGK